MASGTLYAVSISTEVHTVCLSHALSSETEEIMGLLLGDIKDEKDGRVAYVWGVSLHVRSDRRADRVEIHPEQLAAAAAEAEAIGEKMGLCVRVIGWYHSHPHITVLPSHVDVRTQGQYQMLDDGFIGLIFSVFNTVNKNTCRVQVTAFQSLLVPPTHPSLQTDRSFAQADERFFVHKEVPLSFFSPPPTHLAAALNPLVELQRLLLREERAAFLTSLERERHGGSAGGGGVHPLHLLHNSAVLQKVLCRLTEYSAAPLLHSFLHRQQVNQQQLEKLKQEEQLLAAELAALESQ